jgi:predicted nucleic acid-binding protein
VIVLDASAAAELVLRSKPREAWVRARLLEHGDGLHAPHLLDVEVTSAIRRNLLRRAISSSAAEAALTDFQALRVTRYPHTPLVDRAWSLRRTVSVADAMYVALAELLELPLLTCDAALARGHGHSASVIAYPG